MTTHTINAETTEQYCDRLDRHMATIEPLHRAAFRQPAAPAYNPGDLVWAVDHHSTCRVADVTVAGEGRLAYVVISAGDHCQLDTELRYEARHLRPATEEHIHRGGPY